MAIQRHIHPIFIGLETGFQALVEAVQQGEETAALEQRQRNLVMLTDTARQMNILTQERSEALRRIEQLDIQNRIATLNNLIELQRQLNQVVVEELANQLQHIQIDAAALRNDIVRERRAAQENIDLLVQQNLEMREHIGDFFGKGRWQKYYGDVGVEPPLPNDLQRILEGPCPFWPGKMVKETHLLVLIPATVNGQLLTLNKFQELIQNPRQGNRMPQYRYYRGAAIIGEIPIQQSYWALIPNDVIPGSRGKTCAERQALIAQYPLYQTSKALEAAVCITMKFVVSGIRLFNPGSRPPTYSEMPTYSICEAYRETENVAQGDDMYYIVVGGFDLEGLDITPRLVNYLAYGLAPIRRF